MLASFFWASDSSFSRLLDLSFLTSSLFFFFSFSFKAFTAFGLTLNPSLNHHYPLFIRLRTLFKPSSTIKSLIFQLIPTKSVMIQKRSLYCCIFLMKVGRQENADPLILHTSFFLFMFNSSVPPKMSICWSLFFSFFGFSLFETKPPQPASDGLPSRDLETLKITF